MYQLVPENQVQFGKVLSESLTLFWRHRALWIASIIAGMLGQGRVGMSFNVSQSQPFPQTNPGELPDFQRMFQGTFLEDFIRNPVPYLVIGGAIWLLWGLITLIFGSWAAGALICMVEEIEQRGTTSLGSGWRAARARLGTLIRLRLVVILPFLLALAIIMVPLLPFWLQMMRILFLPADQVAQAMQNFNPGPLSALFCMIPVVICIFLPVTLILAALSVFGERACLLEGMGVRQGLRRGWQILRKQIGYTILAWVMTIFITLGAGIVLMLPLLPFWLRTATGFFERGFSADVLTNFVIVGVYSLLVSLTLGSLIGGWISVFWTKLYLAFTGFRRESDASPAVG